MTTENEKRSEFLGYSLFNDIENDSLQAYNRCRTAFNCSEENGRSGLMGYIRELDPMGRAKVLTMLAFIKTEGWDAVNASIHRINNAAVV